MEDNDDNWEDETVVPIDDRQDEAIPLDRPGGTSGTGPEKPSLWGPLAPETHRMVSGHIHRNIPSQGKMVPLSWTDGRAHSTVAFQSISC